MARVKGAGANGVYAYVKEQDDRFREMAGLPEHVGPFTAVHGWELPEELGFGVDGLYRVDEDDTITKVEER